MSDPAAGSILRGGFPLAMCSAGSAMDRRFRPAA